MADPTPPPAMPPLEAELSFAEAHAQRRFTHAYVLARGNHLMHMADVVEARRLARQDVAALHSGIVCLRSTLFTLLNVLKALDNAHPPRPAPRLTVAAPSPQSAARAKRPPSRSPTWRDLERDDITPSKKNRRVKHVTIKMR